MHILKLTNGLRLLAHNVLHAPDTFKTPSEVILAAKLIELLDCPIVTEKEANEEWQNLTASDIEFSEKQRDLLKAAVEKHITKISPTKHAVSLLTQLGFE